MEYNRCSKENLIKHGALNKVSSLYELARLAKTLEEKVNASAKTEVSLLSLCVQYYDFIIANTLYPSMWIFSSATLLDSVSIYSKNRLLFYKKSLSKEFKVCLV